MRLLVLGFLACVLTASHAAHACGESLRYRPQVGQEWIFGVELRIVCRDVRKPETRKRCRIHYQITAVNNDSWEASFKTIPYGQHGPYRNPEDIRGPVIRTQSISKVTVRSSGQTLNHPGVPDFARASHERMIQNAVRMKQISENNLKYYPGVYQFCSGQMRANFQGELLSATTSTNSPLLLGPIIGLPLVRLSENDTSEPFGYKDIRKLNFVRVKDGNADTTATSYSLLQTVTPASSSSPIVVQFDVETEMAGGVNTGSAIRLSGSGFNDFSRRDGMPLQGRTDYIVQGLSFGISGKSFDVEASFLRLDGWRRELFDAMMIANAKALSKAAMPRLPSQLSAELQTRLLKRDRMIFISDRDPISRYAPPPHGSKIWNIVDAMANREMEDESPEAKPSTDQKRTNDAIELSRAIRKRWIDVYRLATKVERNWADTSGSFSVPARMLGRTDTSVALLRTDNGQRINVPLERLSNDDREIAETFGLTPDALNEVRQIESTRPAGT
ncbi:hypothetical protein FHS27_000561 [Rhodopirellula rubra]|uniref:SLA1 homology domain-containing protein n=1 Tax=Aporhodopirellula rubra TaxID=980271 RepID=A0A7W5DUH8_9BACT|nr:SHD1 domain-containing protein [Aporhodopirellula rubra]MBB3204794.1 hypothetical protein [Aporhodopirellula rubra]